MENDNNTLISQKWDFYQNALPCTTKLPLMAEKTLKCPKIF